MCLLPPGQSHASQRSGHHHHQHHFTRSRRDLAVDQRVRLAPFITPRTIDVEDDDDDASSTGKAKHSIAERKLAQAWCALDACVRCAVMV